MARAVTCTKRAALLCAVLIAAISVMPAVSQTIPIGSYADLGKIGADPDFPLDGNYELTGNIDASPSKTASGGAGFAPIGTTNDPFTGTFDGKNHTISGLFINRTTMPQGRSVGLFGRVSNAAISNVVVEADSVAGATDVGILAGRADSSVFSGCRVSGRVSASSSNVGGLIGAAYNSVLTGSASAAAVYGSESVGGLVGFARGGNVSECRFSGSVYGTGWSSNSNQTFGGLIGRSESQTVNDSYSSDSARIVVRSGSRFGGLIGFSSSTVTGCYSSAVLTLSDTWSRPNMVGGLIGENRGTVTNSHYVRPNRGVSITGGVDVGGLIGANDGGTVTNSYATVSVFGDSAVGGLIGGNYNRGTVERSRYETVIDVNIFSVDDTTTLVSVTAHDSINAAGNRAGGLIGSNHGRVTRSHAISYLKGQSNVGGLVGWNGDTLTQSYSAGGFVIAAGDTVGGLVGNNHLGVITNCYSTNAVKGEAFVGGLVGRQTTTWGISTYIVESYYAGALTGSDSETTGGLIGGAPNSLTSAVERSWWDETVSKVTVSAGGSGRTTAEMQDNALAYDVNEGLGWDLVNVWRFTVGQYPILRWESEPVSIFFRNTQRRAGAVGAIAPKVVIRGQTLNFTAPAGMNYRIRLIDMRGRTVAGFRANGNDSFRLGRVAAGRYLVETRVNGKIISVSTHNI